LLSSEIGNLSISVAVRPPVSHPFVSSPGLASGADPKRQLSGNHAPWGFNWINFDPFVAGLSVRDPKGPSFGWGSRGAFVVLNEKDAILQAAHEELSYRRWSFVSSSSRFLDQAVAEHLRSFVDLIRWRPRRVANFFRSFDSMKQDRYGPLQFFVSLFVD
jgi:hypothetical protein